MPDRAMINAFFTKPTPLTSPGAFASLVEALPPDIPSLVRAVQGVTIHEYLAGAYGVQVPDDRRAESHLRRTEDMLASIVAESNAPLDEARPPERRLVGICRNIAVLFISLARAKGIPARVRGGFGTYFNPGFFEDHWIAEYWNGDRWVLLDPQLDEVQRRVLGVTFDPFDVPATKFVLSPVAWQAYRSGVADPARYGIAVGDLRGPWFIAASVVRDFACLNNMPMLPWDVWGAMPGINQPVADVAFIDTVATLLLDPDTHFAEICTLYRDERLSVPDQMFNANRTRLEPALS